MIGGEALRGALRLASLLVVLSAVTVAFEDRSSPEFVVAAMALAVSLVFLLVIVAVSRAGTTRMPEVRDSERANLYNSGRSARGEHSGRSARGENTGGDHERSGPDDLV